VAAHVGSLDLCRAVCICVGSSVIALSKCSRRWSHQIHRPIVRSGLSAAGSVTVKSMFITLMERGAFKRNEEASKKLVLGGKWKGTNLLLRVKPGVMRSHRCVHDYLCTDDMMILEIQGYRGRVQEVLSRLRQKSNQWIKPTAPHGNDLNLIATARGCGLSPSR
jgi:hypothetical protein